jgi:hypothetical protein
MSMVPAAEMELDTGQLLLDAIRWRLDHLARLRLFGVLTPSERDEYQMLCQQERRALLGRLTS